MKFPNSKEELECGLRKARRRPTNHALAEPYFTGSDIDPLAKARRAYIAHLKEAANYSEEDQKIADELGGAFAPLLELTNDESRYLTKSSKWRQ